MDRFLFGSMAVIEKPIRDNFKLHTHDSYEVYVYLEGDTDYIVEGTTYPLEKYDIIVLRPGEMHRAFHKSQHRYKRMVFDIHEEFFEHNNCREYLAIFNNREVGKQNKIPAGVVKDSGLADAIERWFKYTKEGKGFSAIYNSVFIEILHIMNNTEILYADEESDRLIPNLISYINKNFTRKITLEELAEEFYVSKYHLCREFKKHTGHTIISYVNNKRLNKVKELYKLGMSINKACTEAGFSGYSAFYKMYSGVFGTSPKDGLN